MSRNEIRASCVKAVEFGLAGVPMWPDYDSLQFASESIGGFNGT